ncbi:sugar transferase [Nesterenkonia ebinurensis]|uniref:sugar transferase n=1 Tax=Nesterenkonia ebinurensis TaxID=2608252 RepID=UPI001CC58FA2|nr:sugar transferase [Nesterenkonia ebinurensis]
MSADVEFRNDVKPVVGQEPALRDSGFSAPSQWEKWRKSYARWLAVTDLAVLVAVVLGVQLIWLSLDSNAEYRLPAAGEGNLDYGLVSVAIVALWMTALWLSGSRNPRVLGSGWLEYRVIADWGIRLFAGVATLAFLLKLDLARGYLLLIFPVGVLALLGGRWAWRRWLHRQRRSGLYCRRVLLMGSPASVEHIAGELARQPWAGYQIVGVCLSRGLVGLNSTVAGIPVVGDFEFARSAMQKVSADSVIVTSSDDLDPKRVKELSWELEQGKYSLIVAPSLTDVSGPRIHSRPVSGLPLLHVETPQYSGLRMVMKRGFDILASLGIIAVLAPFMIVIALLVKFTSPGPVFFKQERIGLKGEPFRMLKFRSMHDGADKILTQLDHSEKIDETGILFKMKDDPRMTRVGKILRRYSFDELPQLFNVLGGSMSLVGPRPSLEREVRQYESHVHRRFLVKPGITGLWQVSGRSDLPWEEAVRLDLYYVENWSLTADLAILWRTAKAVVQGSGAY